MNDLDLLRTYEPIVRYTAGELFYPCAVDEYVKSCSLWMTPPHGQPQVLASEGDLDLYTLVQYSGQAEYSGLYMRLVSDPLDGLEYQQWRRRPERVPFYAPGRLSRVPLASRIADSLFDLSLLLRGNVPGGTTAAAEIEYRRMYQHDPRRVYYSRVLREGGWIVLHYLFFYAMNNWRSSFYGVNDHEADWEQIFIFLFEDEPGMAKPYWVAYASHEFKGDDRRRRWDDPTLIKIGDHPVVFAGAGSHASYVEQGEYIMGYTPAFLSPVIKTVNYLRKFWAEKLGQGEVQTNNHRSDPLSFSVPYVDYARGDGKSIGPGQNEEWTPVLISDGTPWVNLYRGLWGLDTRDLLSGERAPSGPKYNRDGSVRMSWYDPLGWAGLDKVYPPGQLPLYVEKRCTAIDAELQALDHQIDNRRAELRDLGLDVAALSAAPYPSALHRQKRKLLEEKQSELHDMRLHQRELKETRQALEKYQERIEQGIWDSPTAHIHRADHPEPPLSSQHRLFEVWAAISGALALLTVFFLLIIHPPLWLLWILGILVVLGAVEAAARQHIINYLINVVITLAVLTSIVLIYEYWQWVIILALVFVATFMVYDNLRELFHSP
jgi:hypothetical protein